MDYPVKILPNETFKLIDCDINDNNLIRHTPSRNIFDNEVELIFDKAVCDPSSNMQDLSTSLLGIFIPEYSFIQLTEQGLQVYNSECPPDTSVATPVFNRDFIINDNRGYWFVQIDKIQNQSAVYKIANDEFKATCKVCHTPMKWNYWHFSIRWYLEKENCFWNDLNERDRKKSWSDRLAHETRSILRMYAFINEPNYYELDQSCYTK